MNQDSVIWPDPIMYGDWKEWARRTTQVQQQIRAQENDAIIALGSTHARSLRDRFADFQNVFNFGVAGDGVTDDAPQFQAAIDAVAVSGRTLYVPGGHVYKLDSTLVVPSDVTIIGFGRDATLDFSGVGLDGNGFSLDTVSLTRISGLKIMGLARTSGQGTGAALFLKDCTRCSFDFNFIDQWSYGFTNGAGGPAVGTLTNSRIAFNFMTNISLAGAALLMLRCRFNTNHEEFVAGVGPLVATSEFAGSDENIFEGNYFGLAAPTLVGPNTVFSPDSNRIPPTVTLLDQINQSAANITTYTQYFRNSRTQNSNINFDTLSVFGALPYVGRRLLVHLRAEGGTNPLRTITMRDKATSAAGTGGFELQNNHDLRCAQREEWLVELRVNPDRTAWVEVSRQRIVQVTTSVAAAASITVAHTPYGSFYTITNVTGANVTVNTISTLSAGGGNLGERLSLRLQPTGAGSQITLANAAGNLSLANNANFVITVAVADGLIELQWNGTAWMEMNRADNV